MSRITLVSWNIYTHHSIADVHLQLGEVTHAHNPDVIVLYEASHMYGHLSGLGYKVSQLKPKANPQIHKKGDVWSSGETAILTRIGLKRHGVFSMVMSKFWKGPHLGAPQDPRVYRWVRVEKDGVIWKIGGFHVPFGQSARSESVRAIRKWFRKTLSKRPVVALGDYNMGQKEVQSRIGSKVGAKTAGQGIDLVEYESCRLISASNLGKRGSDHPMMKYLLED